MNPFLRLVLAASLSFVASLGHAQTYPSKPIKRVVPFPPAGNVDLSARIIAPELMNPAPAALEGIADCHFHVIAPPEQFPMFAGRSYTPPPAPLERWREALGPLGVTRGVVVQPSFYGCDKRVMLAVLQQGGGELVGIAAVDAGAADEELDALAAAGVRGVRMAHFEAGDPRAFRS